MPSLVVGQLAKVVNSPNPWANGRTVIITGVGPYLTTKGWTKYICCFGLRPVEDMFGIDDENLMPLCEDKGSWTAIELLTGWNPKKCNR